MRANAYRVKSEIALALGLALLALAFRLYGLADKPIWYDEFLTLRRASLPLAELVTDSFLNKHYPTYFLLVRPFASVMVDEWSLRLPSVVFGAIAVGMVALIACEIRGWRAGLIGGLLMALSPFDVQFAQEARPYSLVSGLVLLALWGLVRITRSPDGAAIAPHRSGALAGSWAAYTFGTLGALYALGITFPWLVASNFVLAVVARQAGSARAGFVRNWAMSQAVVLLVWMPGVIAMSLANQGAVLRGVSWMPKVTAENLWAILSTVYLFRVSDLMNFMPFPAPVPGIGFAVVALAAFGAWRLRTEPMTLAALGLAFVAMPVTVLIVSAFQPMLVPRYLLWSTGPYLVLAGVGATLVHGRLFAVLGAAIAIVGAVNLAPYYRIDTKPLWNRATEFLATQTRAGDSIVVNDWPAKLMVDAYAGRFKLAPGVPVIEYRASRPLPQPEGDRRVWVVFGRTGQGTMPPEENFLMRLSSLGTPAATIRFRPHIVIWQFDAKASAPAAD